MENSMVKNVWTVISVISVAILCLAGCQSEKITSVPDNFSLKWRTGPTHADRGPHAFIHITKVDGGYLLEKGKNYKFYSKEDFSLKDKTEIDVKKTLTEQDVMSLCQLIVDEDILDMDKRYRDPEIMDGDYKYVEISWQDATKKISAVNVTPKPLKKLIIKLEGLAKPKKDV